MLRRSQFEHTDTVRLSGGEPLQRGPVFLALDDENRPLRVVQVDVLTTLGALSALSKAKAMYKNAATVVPAITDVGESDENGAYQIRVWRRGTLATD